MTTNERFLYLVAGTGIGTIIGILFAPKAGHELRDNISSQAHRGLDLISEKVEEGKKYVQERGGAGATVRSIVERGKQRVNEAIEAGQEEYRRNSEGAL
jgi:gas vesicle protein